ASGNSPIPTLSSTMTMARVNMSRAKGAGQPGGAGRALPRLRPEVVRDRLGRGDHGDRVLEDHVIGAGVVEHHRKAIEILDSALELRAVHHPEWKGVVFGAHVVQEDVLDVWFDGA